MLARWHWVNSFCVGMSTSSRRPTGPSVPLLPARMPAHDVRRASWAHVRAIAHMTGSHHLDEMQEQVQDPPEAVRRAAALFATNVTSARERVAASERVVGRRTVHLATAEPRALGTVAAARKVTRAEGALLAAALLRAMYRRTGRVGDDRR